LWLKSFSVKRFYKNYKYREKGDVAVEQPAPTSIQLNSAEKPVAIKKIDLIREWKLPKAIPAPEPVVYWSSKNVQQNQPESKISKRLTPRIQSKVQHTYKTAENTKLKGRNANDKRQRKESEHSHGDFSGDQRKLKQKVDRRLQSLDLPVYVEDGRDVLTGMNANMFL